MKKRDPETAIFDLDLSLQHAILGAPGDPKQHVRQLLDRMKVSKFEAIKNCTDLLRQRYPKQFSKNAQAFELGNPRFLLLLWEMASTFAPNDRAIDRAVTTAFSASKLDIKNPLDWRLLLEVFCWAHFGEHKKAGAPVRWTDERYCALLRHVAEAKATKRVTTDKAACAAIKKMFASAYSAISAERLRKALREARDPSFNRTLAKPVYTAAMSEARVRNLNTIESGKLIRALSRREADRIGDEWRSLSTLSNKSRPK